MHLSSEHKCPLQPLMRRPGIYRLIVHSLRYDSFIRRSGSLFLEIELANGTENAYRGHVCLYVSCLVSDSNGSVGISSRCRHFS